jgi:large subunit ribosomal protein L17
MKHGKKVNHLGRKVAHRKSMLANMACSLIEHKRINTTVAKAKALKQFVEPIITKSKSDTTHNRRLAFSALRNKYAVSILFREVAQKVGDRPGGYTRVIKMGNRLGDNASMAMIELVDFNEVYKADITASKKSTRRSRAPKKVDTTIDNIVSTADTENVSNEAPSPEVPSPKSEKDEYTKGSEPKKEGDV